MNATSDDRVATMGAMIPPSLWPIRPIRVASISLRVLRNAIPARTSPAKSSLVEFWYFPSSRRLPGRRSVARPRRGGSARRPEPERACARRSLVAVLSTRAADQDQGRERPGAFRLGQRPGQGDSAALVGIADLDHLVGEGGFGCLRPAGSVSFSVTFKTSGKPLPAWVHVPSACVPSVFSVPSYLPRIAFISNASVFLSRVCDQPSIPWRPGRGYPSWPSACLRRSCGCARRAAGSGRPRRSASLPRAAPGRQGRSAASARWLLRRPHD